ncbi:hypothetical protein LEP1GSC037_3208 [Leptospira interrogans str. 2006001854]|uniref:Uncharacterized protein n=1 Tax=Leptospira interrogans str. 2006001854 TaxID=1001590 RepID=M6GFJ5_LEPIR|nr:hypothetical protein LEP1GSC037_3208 [Leptospira interrogans str. 2006001854]
MKKSQNSFSLSFQTFLKFYIRYSKQFQKSKSKNFGYFKKNLIINT